MKLCDIIFCDDIRYELNNKLSLMGLYSDRLVILANSRNAIQWPIRVKLAVLLRFNFEDKDQEPDRFEFEYLVNEKRLPQTKGELVTKLQTQASLGLVANGIPLELGYLGFSIKLYKGNELLFSEQRKQALKIVSE